MYVATYSYNMSKRDLPDIYAQAPGLQAQGRRCWHNIYQANLPSAHVITNVYMYHHGT